MVPDAWQAEVSSHLLSEENVSAWLEVDLDGELLFAKNVIILTDRRVLSPGDAEKSWQSWALQPDLSLKLTDHAGVGTLEAQKLSARLQAMLGAALREREPYPHAAERVLVDLTHEQVALQDALGDVLTGEGGHLSLHLRANDLASFKTKKPLAYADKLIDIWLLSLAAAAMDQPLRCVVVGRNAVLRVPEQAPQVAREQLTTLLTTWTEGMRWPLPLPPGVALQWLKDPENLNALADAYEGGEFKSGEKGKDPALARTYPTLQDLLATGELGRLAQAVYAPLKAWAEHIDIAPLPGAPEAGDSDEGGEWP